MVLLGFSCFFLLFCPRFVLLWPYYSRPFRECVSFSMPRIFLRVSDAIRAFSGVDAHVFTWIPCRLAKDRPDFFNHRKYRPVFQGFLKNNKSLRKRLLMVLEA